jgi:GTP-binding protein HflX
VDLLVPYAEGALLAELHEAAGDLERTDTPEGVRIRARLPATQAERYVRYAADRNGASPSPNGASAAAPA